jgi:hypothetical protein
MLELRAFLVAKLSFISEAPLIMAPKLPSTQIYLLKMLKKVWTVCGQPNIVKAKTGVPITNDIIPSISFTSTCSSIITITLARARSRSIITTTLACSFSLSVALRLQKWLELIKNCSVEVE